MPPTRPSIREQIAARRKALLEVSPPGRTTSPARPPPTPHQALVDDAPAAPPDTDIFGRTIPRLIRKAMMMGRLDVANMSLGRLPRELWTRILGLTGDDLPPDLDVEEGKTPVVQADEELMSVPFYQVEDLCVIRASGNEIRVVEAQVGLIGALRVLDVSAFFWRSTSKDRAEAV